jgi:diaminopimelate epimerase
MTEPIEFAKLSGSGNDFICIDNRDGRFDDLLAAAERIGHFARTLCRRGLSVGADGIIFAVPAEDAEEADIGVRFFEPDGSEAELCGNGSACFTRWVVDSGWVDGNEVRIETPSGVARGREDKDGYIHVCIPIPRDLQTDIEITTDGKPWKMDFAVTGVPHAVVYVDDVETLDMQRWGPAIRHHGHFGPRGVNVNFTQVLGEGRLAVRTFEFGVENETLACGTGCATAALMSALRFGWPKDYLCQGEPILVHVRGGDILKLYLLVHDDGMIEKVCLESVVRFLYFAQLHPEMTAHALGAAAAEPQPVGA